MSAAKKAAEARLHELQLQLIEIEKAKKVEASVRKEIIKMQEEIAEAHSASGFYKKEDSGDEDTADPQPARARANSGKSPASCPAKSPALSAAAAPNTEDAAKKRIKALNKKLQQIAVLKEKDFADLDADAKAKVSSESKIIQEIEALKKGEVFEDDSDGDVKSAMLPTNPAEVEKRLKALRKKLEQITKLKASKDLDPEAAKKVASERRITQEVEALERGDKHVVFEEQDPVEAAAEEKQEAEKKLKAVKKKLTQIEKMKEAGGALDAEAQQKVSQQKALQKEAHVLTEQIANINKAERARVEERLGWEAEQVKSGKKGKK